MDESGFELVTANRNYGHSQKGEKCIKIERFIPDNRGPLHGTDEWDRPEAHHLSRWCAEGSGAGCTRNQDPEVRMRVAADEDADVTDEDLGDPDHGEAHGRTSRWADN
ncbi:Hypothetical predicted protein [Mytilus galloprovincialis]|uniref:Uncharacterized protein n=1 Tax=Mytilus galloprovincialis TaxID=29158 RepID=A0A8B6CKP0_MYTGA|nr:Hypothetical predicted protein [Mytilus galloprovincialis]